VDDQQPPFLVSGERKTGSFRREFHFPASVAVEEVEAKLNVGLLHIKVRQTRDLGLEGAGKVKVHGIIWER
jgi:HSP20 family molecular chaperone IbpA